MKAHGLGSAFLGGALLMTLILLTNSSDPFSSWIVAILGFWEVLWLREFRRFIDVFLVVGLQGDLMVGVFGFEGLRLLPLMLLPCGCLAFQV